MSTFFGTRDKVYKLGGTLYALSCNPTRAPGPARGGWWFYRPLAQKVIARVNGTWTSDWQVTLQKRRRPSSPGETLFVWTFDTKEEAQQLWEQLTTQVKQTGLLGLLKQYAEIEHQRLTKNR